MKKRKNIITILALCLLSCMILFIFSACKEEVAPSGLDLLVEEYRLEVGSSQKIASVSNDGAKIVYESENAGVATVDENGTLTGVAAGVTYVAVRAEDKSLTCKVTVTQSEYAVVIGYENVNLVVGSNINFSAQLLKNGTAYDGNVGWSVSSPDKCTFESSGASAKFTATQAGNFTVTAASDRASASCNVKVVNVGAAKVDTPDLSVEHCDKIKWNSLTGASAYAVSINDGEWTEVSGTEYSVAELSNGLQDGAKISVKVKGLTKDNYNYIDSYIASLFIQHDYAIEELAAATCTQSGVGKFTCRSCARTYTDNAYLRPHVFEHNVCKNCNQERTPALLYLYDEEQDCYFVAGVKDKDVSVVYVAGYYDDGLHGKKPVKYIGQSAFFLNIGITHLILPETVEVLYEHAFHAMQDLEYISMPGVSKITYYHYGVPAEPDYTGMSEAEKAAAQEQYNIVKQAASTGMNQFQNCMKLRTVIVKKDLVLSIQAFIHNKKIDNYQPITKIYALEKGGRISTGAVNSNLLTGEILYYNENNKCGTWHYAEDGYSVVETDAEHLYDEFGNCFKCGTRDGQGLIYEYDAAKDSYYVMGVEKNHTFEANANGDVVVRVQNTYNDGANGEKPVTYLADSALRYSTDTTSRYHIPSLLEITHLILPENVTELRMSCCQGLANLEYVSMLGVSQIKGKDGSGADAVAQFRYCPKLETLIIKKNLNITTNALLDGTPNATKIYALEKDGAITFGSDGGWINNNPMLYKENGKVTACVYDGNGYCNTWKYDAEDGYTLVLAPTEHNFVSGICTVCNAYDAQGIEYSYDATSQTYFVSGIADKTRFVADASGDVVVRIHSTFNDGAHGVKAVTYIGAHGLQSNTTVGSTYYNSGSELITHLILPESITELRIACFQGMRNLEYVAMPGVTEIKSKDSSNADSNAQFRYCNALTAVVVKKSLDIRTNAFISESGGIPANQVQIYALEDGGTFPFGVNDGGWINVNVALKTEDGTHTNVRTGSPLSVLVKGTDWDYADDGYTIVPVS